MTTAEWVCTKCGSTNRRLVADGAARTKDRCYSCKTRHTLERRERPVFWHAVAQT